MATTGERDPDERWKRDDSRHHDREAPRYDELIGREFEAYQHLFTARPWARMLAEDGAGVVLDVGCGTGRTAVPIAMAGPAVIAMDMSRGMLTLALSKASAAGLEGRVWPLVADAESIPLASGSVRGAVAQGVLHHLPSPGRALTEMDRVISAGAWLCLAEPDIESSRLYRAVRTLLQIAASVPRPSRWRSPAANHERPLAPEALLGPLEAMGYRPAAQYLRHPPILYRFLPQGMAKRLARWLNSGNHTQRRPADILVVRARKPYRKDST